MLEYFKPYYYCDVFLGVVLFVFGALASSLIGGYYKNLAAQDINLMFPAFIIAAICTCVALGLVLLLKTKTAKPAV